MGACSLFLLLAHRVTVLLARVVSVVVTAVADVAASAAAIVAVSEVVTAVVTPRADTNQFPRSKRKNPGSARVFSFLLFTQSPPYLFLSNCFNNLKAGSADILTRPSI